MFFSSLLRTLRVRRDALRGVVWTRWFGLVSIHVLPVADLHNADLQDIVLDFVKHVVHSAPKSVLLCAGQFS